ncbi:TNF receptor-associated factor 4 [Desmophyllum pertusum]|uniref:TNF receptor-associated factor 4 n=1 Tax=Desmophyllum pertusum TaxID=174260 RepID=A0A9W9YKL3_9CNID|nr:TNF receptor-associated factor 4 [Desmophyllum pertusum]
MRDAVQTSECGHRFCEDCLHGILRSGHSVCPNDRREIQGEGGVSTDDTLKKSILLSYGVTAELVYFSKSRAAKPPSGTVVF